MKVLSKLSAELAEEIEKFTSENFYTEREKTLEGQLALRERFFSQPKAWLLAFKDDQIIGTILLHKRRTNFKNQELILGGIGRVCTRKDKRNQGIATAMLKKAVKILKEWGCDIAYLCADIEKTGALYAQVGFVPLNKPYTYFGQSGTLYEGTSGMIAPINSSDIFNDVLHSEQKLHIGKGNW